MMNIQETAGEPSCKRQENGDGSTGSERPLKKARFAWQVKGNRKYHLKTDTNETKSASTSSTELDKPGTSDNTSNTHDIMGTAEQNLEILGDYLLKQDFNTLDSVITDSDNSSQGTSLSTEKLDYPRYVSTYESNSRTSSNREAHNMSMSMSMAVSQNYNEDQCIARWQARQMAKGFVDNTINRVLDSWMEGRHPLPADIDNRFLALDVAEFINNLPGDNSIENEGILMAISAHGLQNTSSSSSNDGSPRDSTSTKAEIFPSRSSSPIQSDEEIDNNNSNDTNSQNVGNKMAWSYDDREAENTKSDFSLYPDMTSSSYLSYDNEQLQNSSSRFEVDNGANDFASHFDFMDAAVSFAIQNKGLTSYGADYG